MKKKYFYLFSVLCVAVLMIIAAASNEVIAVMGSKPAPFAPVLIIDAGHGGMDGGAVGVDKALEKDINLSIAKKLSSMAKAYGFEVLMTREEDVSIHDDGVTGIRNQKVSDIHNRLKLSQENPGAIFISIHQNKFTQQRYWGTQVFYSRQNPESKAIAEIIKDNVRESLQPENSRETKPAQKDLYILYNSTNPAVMIECGFLSNPQECERLQDEKYQQGLAFVILSSIIEYCQVLQDEGIPVNGY